LLSSRSSSSRSDLFDGNWVARRARNPVIDGRDALKEAKKKRFERVVPRIPQPKSEAWLICALEPAPYQGCETLEERSGSGRK